MKDGISQSEVERYLAAQPQVKFAARYPAGAIIDGWRVTALLGKGGSAEVYRVERITDNFSAALKIGRDGVPSPSVTRLDTEIAFLHSNVSPHFPRFFADGVHEGCRYYVMELLEPLPLPSSDRAVASYALSVCAAVKHLHRHGYVHRDIKPHNILGRAGCPHAAALTPVLADLGLLRALPETDTQTGATVTIIDGKAVGSGTPRYAAPEQFNGGRLSAATDIHAIGMLLDECFANHPPRCWEQIIRRATSSIPERRYCEVDDLIAAIKSRHRAWTLSIAAALLLSLSLAILGGVYWWRTGGEENCRWRSLGRVVETVDGGETVVNLAQATNVFVYPFRLKDGKYRIVGPGILEANLIGSSNVFVHLSRCVVLNTTQTRPPENAIRYYVDDGVYLNFTGLERTEAILKNIQMHDAAYSTLRFKGPRTLRELETERYNKFLKSVERERYDSNRIGNREFQLTKSTPLC